MIYCESMRKNTPQRIVALVTPTGMTGRAMISGILETLESEPTCELKMFDSVRTLTPKAVRDLCKGATTGFILSLTPNHDTLTTLDRLESPIVYVNVRDAENEHHNVRYIWNDNASIGRMAAKHLAELGVECFAFAGIKGENWSKSRGLGFAAALPHHATLTQADFPLALTKRADRKRLKEWIRSLPKPVALFASCNFLAHDIETLAREAGMGIPSQVAIIGVDDGYRNVSTVLPDYREMGRKAASILFALMNRRHCPADPICVEPSNVALRYSTRQKKAGSQLARKITEYIEQHLSDDLGAPRIASALGISRSSLEHQFKATTKVSLRKAVEAARMKNVRRLLETRQLTLKEIAKRCGFSSAARLSHVFRQRFGISPVAWGKSQSN